MAAAAAAVEISPSDLISHILLSLPSDHSRLLIGVVGAPGAGKSAVSRHLVAEINRISNNNIAILVPLDGFHYTRHYLDTQMADPVAARRYRGAHWTFDKEGFITCLNRLKNCDNVDCPQFDHSVHDPEEGKIKVREHHRIVIVEGLWVFYPPWGLPDDIYQIKVLVKASAKNRQYRVGNLPDM
ncbi:Pantothenate kinase, putative [Perkinsus marinus ATCC 50983]|uniref:Pantothenate kinase, putative n=1 Tax=Perkinsus marinus (strain ATCC 50983 / TXsc) TaxID=423536 RepID=C5K5Q2_PERM5|nr:Pantothenate kinase, putative [Perkinsus marinus ATCC 50983]EER20209.1 Pantothenate kinase, putative [Perkinsus marinus ATCC 50983]|eukprot:XP_002788413.1 Pantothenate kinase, putative [Perkinsus marinus ATCC 50983]